MMCMNGRTPLHYALVSCSLCSNCAVSINMNMSSGTNNNRSVTYLQIAVDGMSGCQVVSVPLRSAAESKDRQTDVLTLLL
jgi:hypothetical protein